MAERPHYDACLILMGDDLLYSCEFAAEPTLRELTAFVRKCKDVVSGRKLEVLELPQSKYRPGARQYIILTDGEPTDAYLMVSKQ